jgi:hypothetical protein
LGEWFCSRSRFSLHTKIKDTQMSRVAASVGWTYSCPAPFVIDLTEEAAGDKKLTPSNGQGEKWDVNFYCVHASNDRAVRGAHR